MKVPKGCNLHFKRIETMHYDKGKHTVYHHRYHIFWITKYRFKELKGAIRTRVREITRRVCEELDVKIIGGVLIYGSCTCVCIHSTSSGGEWRNETYQGTHFSQNTDGISQSTKKVIGTAFLVSWLFLHNKREGQRWDNTSLHRAPPILPTYSVVV